MPSALECKPEIDRTLYRCVVDGRFGIKKFHLSGLLLFKKLENGTIRAVFQNEMGFTFFDFEWKEDNSFQVNKIIPQLDKEAVIKTLRKDFEMLMMTGLEKEDETIFSEKNCFTKDGVDCPVYYHRFPLEKGEVYYVYDKDRVLRKIVNTGKKKVVTIGVNGVDSCLLGKEIEIVHHKANFTIQLTKIDSHANE